MKKRKSIVRTAFLVVIVIGAFLFAYRFVGVGGKIIKIQTDSEKGFYTEYYLFIPDTLKKTDTTFLLVAPNNTGTTSDDHKVHMDAAHTVARFGQSNILARKLGIPLLVPCFDRPQTNWEMYTHALDRDTLLSTEGETGRIDLQLIAMIADAHTVLGAQGIQLYDKILLNGFSASGSYVNRFTALHPEMVAGTAAGGVNSMVILPLEAKNNIPFIYPVGIADIEDLTGTGFDLAQFALVPQYYYMGEMDENDALPFADAYSDLEREIVIEVLGKDMNTRWMNCKELYKSQNICAEFVTYEGIGHETTKNTNEDIIAFFRKVMEAYK